MIDGKWVPTRCERNFDSINPSNEKVLTAVAEGDRADVDDAVLAARRAFEAAS
jgi:acyl-CoA reductase-like NAD-dependent aldehyde dehydrogenase